MLKREFKTDAIFRKLNKPYRVVFIDDDSLDEVASYQLTMGKLYIVLSTIFVVLLFITVTIMLATPLKYYIPGYGNNKARVQTIKLKRTVDSLSDLVAAQQKYEENIRAVITGDVDKPRDTTMLNMKTVRQEAMNSIMPKTEEIKKSAIESIKQDNKKAKKGAVK